MIFDGYPAEIVIARSERQDARAFKMPRPTGIHVRGYGSPLQWVAGKDDLFFLAEEKGRVRLLRCPGICDGARTRIRDTDQGDVVVEGFSEREPGNPHAFAAIMATPTKLADVYASARAPN